MQLDPTTIKNQIAEYTRVNGIAPTAIGLSLKDYMNHLENNPGCYVVEGVRLKVVVSDDAGYKAALNAGFSDSDIFRVG
jgi:hypothetical protein